MGRKPDEATLRRLGEAVAARRTDLGWSKEQAAREAGISSITWKRVEDGLPVQDAKFVAVLRAVGIATEHQPSAAVRPIHAARSMEDDINLTVRLIARLRVELERAEDRLIWLTRQAAQSDESSHEPEARFTGALAREETTEPSAPGPNLSAVAEHGEPDEDSGEFNT